MACPNCNAGSQIYITASQRWCPTCGARYWSTAQLDVQVPKYYQPVEYQAKPYGDSKFWWYWNDATGDWGVIRKVGRMHPGDFHEGIYLPLVAPPTPPQKQKTPAERLREIAKMALEWEAVRLINEIADELEEDTNAS